jgi:hypothetical protein
LQFYPSAPALPPWIDVILGLGPGINVGGILTILNKYKWIAGGIGIGAIATWWLIRGLSRCWGPYLSCLTSVVVKTGETLAGIGPNPRGYVFCPEGFKGDTDDEIHGNLRTCSRRIINHLAAKCTWEFIKCLLAGGFLPFQQPLLDVPKSICDDLCKPSEFACSNADDATV